MRGGSDPGSDQHLDKYEVGNLIEQVLKRSDY